METIARIFIVAAILYGCKDPVRPSEIIRSEEYAIYSRIIDSLCSRPASIEPGNRKDLFLLLRDSTVLLSLESSYYQQAGPQATDLNGIRDSAVFPHLRKALPSFDWQRVKRDFDSANAHQEPLDSTRLTSRLQFKLISATKIHAILFGRQSPAVFGMPDSVASKSTGFASFSRIGFDRSLNQALVLMTHSVYDGYSGYVIALSKQDSRWTIQCILKSISI